MTENRIPYQEMTPEQWTTIHSRELPGFQDETLSTSGLADINKIAPKPLRMDQVYVRSMYLCSTQPCDSDHCQFSLKALQSISEKIIGQSVMVGHNRSSLPLARFFKSSIVEKKDEQSNEPIYFVRAWFYWMRDTSGAKDLLLNIDGGIYREVSLAWRFQEWSCSVCSKQNGRCDHKPGEMYQNQKCVRVIHHVTDVMEGSLVYKSADKDTVLTGARSLESEDSDLPVILITETSDPVLEYLERENLYAQRTDLTEPSDWLHEGIEQLWFRSVQTETNAEELKPLLCEGGSSVFECYPKTNQAELAFGTLQTVV